MKKGISLKKKKIIRTLIVFTLIQVFIVFLFIRMLNESKPIDLQHTKQIDITVEEIMYERVISEYRFSICAGSAKYSFANSGAFSEYSSRELYESISVGDQISIIYYEKRNILNKSNWVADARTEAKVYRSFEEYNKHRQGVATIAIIIFSIIELLFIGIVSIYVILNKSVFRKSQKRKGVNTD